jgi:hypothetical protein
VEREVVVKRPEPERLPAGVHTCPRCCGWRYETNGGLFVSATEVRWTPPSPCLLCHGSGKVRIEPYEG